MKINLRQSNFQNNFQNNFQYNYDIFDYEEYKKKSQEIYDYFEGLCVMERLTNEKNVWINIIKKDPLFYDAVFLINKDYLIIRNYSIIKNQYSPQFSCIFLFNISWGEQLEILNGDYAHVGLNREIKNEYKFFYRKKIIHDYLKFRKIDISQSIHTMNDGVRIEYDIDDINLDKILELKEFMEASYEKR